MKINKLAAISLFAIPLFLVGCSDSKRVVNLNLHYVAEETPTSIDPHAQAQLAEAASSVDQSLEQLSAIKLAKNPGVKMPAPIDPSEVGMAKKGSFDWNGPVVPAVTRIAKANGYKVRVIGDEPAVPVFVNVTARNQPMSQILRNITYQAAGRADIKIYPSDRVIEVRYR